ncbi:MAG: hypothetical protein Q8O74_10105 [bacterium]|nr:hypothetical protein [bacterium]
MKRTKPKIPGMEARATEIICIGLTTAGMAGSGCCPGNGLGLPAQVGELEGKPRRALSLVEVWRGVSVGR